MPVPVTTGLLCESGNFVETVLRVVLGNSVPARRSVENS
jgi:hypothetical protein